MRRFNTFAATSTIPNSRAVRSSSVPRLVEMRVDVVLEVAQRPELGRGSGWLPRGPERGSSKQAAAHGTQPKPWDHLHLGWCSVPGVVPRRGLLNVQELVPGAGYGTSLFRRGATIAIASL